MHTGFSFVKLLNMSNGIVFISKNVTDTCQVELYKPQTPHNTIVLVQDDFRACYKRVNCIYRCIAK